MKTRKILLPIILLALCLSLSSCLDLIDGIDGNNHPATEFRNVSAFSGVVSRGAFEVRIIQGSTNEVEIEAESNLLQFIETRVLGKNLIIKTHNSRRLNNHQPMIITVTTTEIDKIELDGSGEIIAHNLSATELDVNLSGSGDIDLEATVDEMYASISGSGNIYLEGVTDYSKMHVSGSGDIHAKDFIQNHCEASISGSGKMYIYVNDVIEALISGSGSIYYDGNPDVSSRISGSGKVVHI